MIERTTFKDKFYTAIGRNFILEGATWESGKGISNIRHNYYESWGDWLSWKFCDGTIIFVVFGGVLLILTIMTIISGFKILYMTLW